MSKIIYSHTFDYMQQKHGYTQVVGIAEIVKAC